MHPRGKGGSDDTKRNREVPGNGDGETAASEISQQGGNDYVPPSPEGLSGDCRKSSCFDLSVRADLVELRRLLNQVASGNAPDLNPLRRHVSHMLGSGQ